MQTPEKTPSEKSASDVIGFALMLRGILLPLLFDVVIPIAGYYGLRAAGFTAFPALILGGIPTVCFTIYEMVKHQKVDFLGLFVLAIMAVSITISFVTGSVRFMLAKEGWFTGLIGVIFLFSLLLKRPFAFTIARDLFTRLNTTGNDWDRLWKCVPRFRRIWRVSTITWGVGTLLHALLIVIMAYTFPVDWVPVLGGFLHLGLFVALQVITNIYYKRQGLWQLIFDKAALS